MKSILPVAHNTPVESWLKYRKSAHSWCRSLVKFIKRILLKCILFRSNWWFATPTNTLFSLLERTIYTIHMCNYPYVTWFLTLTQNLCLETHNKPIIRRKMPAWKRQTAICDCELAVLLKLHTDGDRKHVGLRIVHPTVLHTNHSQMSCKLFAMDFLSFDPISTILLFDGEWIEKTQQSPIDIRAVDFFFFTFLFLMQTRKIYTIYADFIHVFHSMQHHKPKR